MALREILGHICWVLVLRTFRGETSGVNTLENYQSCHARVLYWVNTVKYTTSRTGPILENSFYFK